ncbi:MAG: hypothetical protein Q9223_000932 [Gallowayella weberi]
MVVSLEAFQTITVDSTGVAQVGGGVRLGNLATDIYNQSKRALPHGVCPGVGIGGHATHGGYFNWAYTFPIANPNEAATTFSHIQAFALNASVIDDKIGFGVSPSPSSIHISGTYRGEEAEFNTKVASELLRTLPTPSNTSIKTFSWLDSLTDMKGEPLPQPLSGYDAHDNFYAKSILVPETTPLTQSALLNYFTYITTASSKYPPLWFSELNLLGGPSSRINNPPPPAADSAYSGRGALWVVQHYSTTPPAASGGANRAIEFVNGLNDALGTGNPGYPNYVDPELSASEAHNVYFSREIYDRLVRIKAVVDPEGVFWNPQAVGA